jgi:tetratricopeptide (TPR) repeat protein/CHAT domain-containing protein
MLAVLALPYGNSHGADTPGQIYDQVQQLAQQGHYAEAARIGEQLLIKVEEHFGPEHYATANVLNSLGYAYKGMGDYARAKPYYQRALAIREQALGPEHPDTAVSLSNLAMLYDDLGDYASAERLLKRALAIREKVLGPEHPDTALTLNNLGYLYRNTGDYRTAETYYRRALAIDEKMQGPEHPDTANTLSNLAMLYDALRDYARAEPLHKRALHIRQSVLGPEHIDTALSLNNLGAFYDSIGDYPKAADYYQRSLRIVEKTLGPKHHRTASTLNNLGYVYTRMGEYKKAEPYYQRALAIREQVFGPQHIDTAQSLNNLAGLYDKTGDTDKAEDYYQRALAILEQVLGPQHPDIAIPLNNLATLYDSQGKHDKAETYHRRALEIRLQNLGPYHPSTANSLNNLAFTLGAVNRNKEAFALFSRALASQNRIIANMFTVATEAQKLQFVRQSAWGYEGLLSLLSHRLAAEQDKLWAGLDAVLSRKGIVFDAQSRQHEAIAGSLDPATRKLWQDLDARRKALGKLIQAGPGNSSATAYKKRIATLQAEIEQLESALSAKSALVADELNKRRVTAKQLANRLPRDTVLVEFVLIDDYDWGKGQWSGTKRYLAFVLKPGPRLQLLDLGKAAALDSRLEKSLAMLTRPGSTRGKTQLHAAGQLYQQLWSSLSLPVGTPARIIISPDGLLNLVPFGTMRGQDGRYLVEQYEFQYVTSGRDLATVKKQSAKTDLFLAANPDFDRSGNTGIPGKDQGSFRSRDFRMKFTPLPGTAVEASKVPALLHSTRRQVLTGQAATEAAVLAAERPRVLHLATHGFFLPDQLVFSPETGRQGTSISARTTDAYENPLVRSGLAFTGANLAAQVHSANDGLLTALEVSGMNLHGTDLVTLSACETGMGEIENGEGVYGLRRAFLLAGARNLLMSLWPVSDAITAKQMLQFYQRYGDGETPAAALRAAQLETIAGLRKQYGVAPPSLWAPFILQTQALE